MASGCCGRIRNANFIHLSSSLSCCPILSLAVTLHAHSPLPPLLPSLAPQPLVLLLLLPLLKPVDRKTIKETRDAGSLDKIRARTRKSAASVCGCTQGRLCASVSCDERIQVGETFAKNIRPLRELQDGIRRGTICIFCEPGGGTRARSQKPDTWQRPPELCCAATKDAAAQPKAKRDDKIKSVSRVCVCVRARASDAMMMVREVLDGGAGHCRGRLSLVGFVARSSAGSTTSGAKRLQLHLGLLGPLSFAPTLVLTGHSNLQLET